MFGVWYVDFQILRNKLSKMFISKALEEKLALASKKESELQAKIAHLEDSTSTTSLDEV